MRKKFLVSYFGAGNSMTYFVAGEEEEEEVEGRAGYGWRRRGRIDGGEIERQDA